MSHHEDAPLGHHALLHARAYDVALAEALEREGLPRDSVLDKLHNAEGAGPQQAQRLQILPAVEFRW
eukprot:8641928-Heterocapsa_arctica.AAC.1